MILRVTMEDSIDLGFVLTSLAVEAVSKDDVSKWASQAIDDLECAPTYIYTMLDLDGQAGSTLRREIGFNPYDGLETEEEYQYLREIAVRRGRAGVDYLGGKPRATLSAMRTTFINELLKRNFGIDANDLPSLVPSLE